MLAEEEREFVGQRCRDTGISLYSRTTAGSGGRNSDGCESNSDGCESNSDGCAPRSGASIASKSRRAASPAVGGLRRRGPSRCVPLPRLRPRSRWKRGKTTRKRKRRRLQWRWTRRRTYPRRALRPNR